MFLIECEEGVFVNAEKINWIEVDRDKIEFTLEGDVESMFRVCKDHQELFVNHLQCLNNNISSIEAKYHNINKGGEQ